VTVEKLAADPIRLVSPTIEYPYPTDMRPPGQREAASESSLFLGSDTANAVKVDLDEIASLQISQLDQPATVTSPSGKQTMATILAAWNFANGVKSKPPVLVGYDPVTLQIRRYPLAGVRVLTFQKAATNPVVKAGN
jgi:hypothetical protein